MTHHSRDSNGDRPHIATPETDATLVNEREATRRIAIHDRLEC